MADKKESASGSEKSSQGRKRSRRRYFRRKKSSGGEKSGDSSQKEGKKKSQGKRRGKSGSARSGRSRRSRHRRRSRSQKGRSQEPRASILKDIDQNYVPPQSIFVYTHVVRPDVRDSFEFRTDHFSSVSRNLEDFHIDLSALFPEETGIANEPGAADPTAAAGADETATRPARLDDDSMEAQDFDEAPTPFSTDRTWGNDRAADASEAPAAENDPALTTPSTSNGEDKK